MAVMWFRRAADQGNHIAQCNLGQAYLNGDGVEQDNDKAWFWFNESMKGNYVPAYISMGDLYDGIEDYENAAKYYRHGVDKGSSMAMIRLADLYENGYGVSLDKRKAFDLYNKAAEMGDAYGYYSLAYCYLNGVGVKPDISAAIDWYKLAAENFSILNLLVAELLFKERDPESIVWLEKSAASGNPMADIGLGACYAEGIGVEQNLAKAVEIFKKAASISLDHVDCEDEYIRKANYKYVGALYLCWLNFTNDWLWLSKKETVELFCAAYSKYRAHGLDIMFLSDDDFNLMKDEFEKSAFCVRWWSTAISGPLDEKESPVVLWPEGDIERIYMMAGEEVLIGDQYYALDGHKLRFSEAVNKLCQSGKYDSIQAVEIDNSYDPYMGINGYDESVLAVKQGAGFIFETELQNVSDTPHHYCRIYIDKVHTDSSGNVCGIDISYQLSRVR